MIALTKCDRVKSHKILEVSELLSKVKRTPPLVEVSAHDTVNIDLCFLVLAHLIDSRKPKVKVVTYEDSFEVVKERKSKNEKLFKGMLERKLNDFTMTKAVAVAFVRKEAEWEGVAQLLGSPRCEKLVNIRLGQLHVEAVMRQTDIFKEILPDYLTHVLPSVTLEDTVEGCMETIKSHEKFDEYFVRIKNWSDDTQFLHSFSNKVPLTFIEKEGRYGSC